MKCRTMRLTVTVFAAFCAGAATSYAAVHSRNDVRSTVDRTIRPLMAEYGIPGMAVGIVADGKPYVFNYGVASIKAHPPVTGDTLFELGSVSKTFTATLAAYAQVRGDLSLQDRTGKYLPILGSSPFGKVSLLELGTHTPGGVPLQVPAGIRNHEELMQYFKKWRPSYPPGTYRTYTNLGIGLLGLIAAKSMGQNFSGLMEERLFPALGMQHSYINLPIGKMPDYAQGYTEKDAPIRMTPGVLSSEAYGVRTTAGDMVRFVEANMRLIRVNEKYQRAITDTHIGYFKAGEMTQDLIWEQFAYPVALKTLLQGNSPAMIFDATPVTAIRPPQRPQKDVWINKTGSTNGFAAYVAFIPEKRLGIVLLANKSYPISARVMAAYKILSSLAGEEN